METESLDPIKALNRLFGEICITRQISLSVLPYLSLHEHRDLVARYERELYTFGRTVQAMEARYENREPPAGDVEIGPVGPQARPDATADELFSGLRAELHIARHQLAESLKAIESIEDRRILEHEGRVLTAYANAIESPR